MLLISTQQPDRRDLPVNQQTGIHEKLLLTHQIPPLQTQHRRYQGQQAQAEQTQRSDLCQLKI